MDKDDPEYDELRTLMGKIADKSRKGELLKSTDEISKYLKVSQRILKREWEVTKHDMHSTPWGRPISWFVNMQRRRRREEEKEIVRRSREKLLLASPRKLANPFRWLIQWRRRQKPPRDPNAPVLRIGRIEIRAREPRPPEPKKPIGDAV